MNFMLTTTPNVNDAILAERERSAKVAEEWWLKKSGLGSPQIENFNLASNMIAAAIREG